MVHVCWKSWLVDPRLHNTRSLEADIKTGTRGHYGMIAREMNIRSRESVICGLAVLQDVLSHSLECTYFIRKCKNHCTSRRILEVRQNPRLRGGGSWDSHRWVCVVWCGAPSPCWPSSTNLSNAFYTLPRL